MSDIVLCKTLMRPDQIFSRAFNRSDRGIRFYQPNLQDSRYFTYLELSNMAQRQVNLLLAAGVEPKQRVLICADNSLEFVLNWFALLQVAAVPVPVPPSATMAGDDAFAARLLPLMRHHTLLICRSQDWAALGLDGANHQWLNIADCDTSAPALPLQSIRLPWLAADDEAFIQYTSGSTSVPKGLVISYSNIIANTQTIAMGLGLTEHDRFLSWLPLYHDYGLVCNFMLCLLRGLDYVLCMPLSFVKRPLRFMALIARHQATAITMPNFGLQLLLDAAAKQPPENCELSSLRWWSVGAEPVSVSVLDQIRHTFSPFGLKQGVLAPSYGLAEATVAVSFVRPGQSYTLVAHGEQQVLLNGEPLPGFELQIQQPDRHGFGALLMRGPSVASHAYIEGNKVQIQDEQGYVNTKDIACLIDGQLALAGRRDEMVCVRGENLFPYDVEAQIRRLPQLDVRRIACIFVEDDGVGAVVACETKVRDPQRLAEWQQQIRRSLSATCALPVKAVFFVPTKAIPVTTSGKIQRTRLKAQYLAGSFALLCLQQEDAA